MEYKFSLVFPPSIYSHFCRHGVVVWRTSTRRGAPGWEGVNIPRKRRIPNERGNHKNEDEQIHFTKLHNFPTENLIKKSVRYNIGHEWWMRNVEDMGMVGRSQLMLSQKAMKKKLNLLTIFLLKCLFYRFFFSFPFLFFFSAEFGKNMRFSRLHLVCKKW